MPLPFHILDVFTDRAFGGNPLAVVTVARPLPADTMQRVAREFGFSETAFLLPVADGSADHRLRIFTPRMELPFAGHPTIGAAVLITSQRPAGTETTELRLLEDVGVVQVEVTRPAGVTQATLTIPGTPQYGPTPPSRADVAALLGLNDSDLAIGAGAVVPVSAGVPFLLVGVATRDALRRAACNIDIWKRLLAEFWAPHVYLYQEDPSSSTLYARMFAPAMGIVEDPATGAGAAALAAHLALRQPEPDVVLRRTIRQGLEIHRPSTMAIEAVKVGGAITRIRVGGGAVQIASGMLDVPAR